MKKIKTLGKMMAASLIVLLFISGMSSVSACHLDSDLIAGQHIDVGNVEVNHNAYTDHLLYITYSTEGGWVITETHLAVASSLSDIPTNKKGNPKVGHFPYTDPAIEEPTQVQYIIDLDDFPSLYHDGYYYGTLYVAAHAVVNHPCYGSETAWGDTYGQPFPGANSWAMYFTITLNPPS